MAPPEIRDPRTETMVAGPPASAKTEAVTEPPCTRFVQHDSLHWTCACGATGRVGRSPDGMPFVTDELLRHQPGETKE